MSSSDACCVRNGQLEQMMEKDENKNNTFIRAKTLEKIHAHRNETEISRKTFLFYLKIKSKTHPLAR